MGGLEQLTLFALSRLGGEAHGPAIIIEIEERTGKSVAPGALYTVMERMGRKGLVDTWVGDSMPKRGGRRRRMYRLLPEGARALLEWYESIENVAAGTTERLRSLAQLAR